LVDTPGNVGFSTSLELTTSEAARIAYGDETNRDVKFAAESTSPWDIEVVDSPGDVGAFLSLALDAEDCPRIAYYDLTNGNLKYAAESCDAVPPGAADYGDAPDSIPSCQFSTACGSAPTLYPTLFGSGNAPAGRDAPYHLNADPLSSIWLG